MKSDNLITKRIRESMLTEIGPGGMDCPCCRPPLGDIIKLNRKIRRRLKQDLHREVNTIEEEE